jgi:Cof subfamily protein (haloacid dehalogenase superfamily)
MPINSESARTKPGSFPYRLAAIDLDGTLLGRDSKIARANLEAVRRLQQAGVTVILASGRQHQSIMKYQNELELTGPVVSCQGALVIDPQTEQVILLKPLTKSAAARSVAEAERHGATVFYYHSKGIFAQKENKWTAIYEKLTGYQLSWVETFAAFEEGTTYKIIWMHSEERIAALMDMFRAQTMDEVYVVRTMPEALEFLSPLANKANGVEAVAQALDIPRSAILSFGDADNDIPMLSWAGLGVAMSHATEGAKAAARIQAPDGEPDTSFARAVDAVFRHHI